MLEELNVTGCKNKDIARSIIKTAFKINKKAYIYNAGLLELAHFGAKSTSKLSKSKDDRD